MFCAINHSDIGNGLQWISAPDGGSLSFDRLLGFDAISGLAEGFP